MFDISRLRRDSYRRMAMRRYFVFPYSRSSRGFLGLDGSDREDGDLRQTADGAQRFLCPVSVENGVIVLGFHVTSQHANGVTLSSPFVLSADSSRKNADSLSPEQLARENLPLAKYLAVEKARTAEHLRLDDLMSAAQLGLARAALAYDPERGIPFGAFARSQINWAMLDEMRAADPAGERSRAKIERVRVAAETVLSRTGRAATLSELSRESGLDTAVVAKMLQLDDMVRTATSFEAHFDAESGRQATDLTDSVILPEHAAEQSENRAMLMRVMNALPEAMQKVIRGIYIEDRMVKDIAEELAVSHAYVSKLRSMGLTLMREAMEAWENGTEVDRSTKAKAAFFDAVLGPVTRPAV